ncbi:hypothetical protein CLIB1423_15S00848 [[Candida] railenensis]|uniref:Uncharacterized protein n=1 Tax=[Candida] railenensis TaxID=45579 RepID=A0A9P0QSK4_9ASCO|nr:hypothetical protein CLIB1423_15S00848 [[Candida] railenensis]
MGEENEHKEKEHKHHHIGGFVASVAGGVGGAQVGSALGLGGAGDIASSVAGSMGAQRLQQKASSHRNAKKEEGK